MLSNLLTLASFASNLPSAVATVLYCCTGHDDAHHLAI